MASGPPDELEENQRYLTREKLLTRIVNQNIKIKRLKTAILHLEDKLKIIAGCSDPRCHLCIKCLNACRKGE